MTKRTMLRARRGYAMMTTLLYGAVFLLMGASLASLAVTNARLSSKRLVNTQALSLATGGADEATSRLIMDKSWSGFSTREVGPGNLGVTVTVPAAYPRRRIVLSTGWARTYAVDSTKVIRTTYSEDVVPPIFYNAIASKQDLVLNGDVTTSSQVVVSEGNVHSNANVYLNGSAIFVDGRATASSNVNISGTPTVVNGIYSKVPPMVFPEVDPNFEQIATADGVTDGNVTVSDGRTIKGKIVGNLTVLEPSGCAVDGVVWVTGTLTVKGPVSGRGTLICVGKMYLEAVNEYPTEDNRRLMFICLANDKPAAVELSGNRQFKGVVYAPNGTVKISGTPTLYGGILADQVKIDGTPQIYRWPDLDVNDPPMPTYLQLIGWEEL